MSSTSKLNDQLKRLREKLVPTDARGRLIHVKRDAVRAPTLTLILNNAEELLNQLYRKGASFGFIADAEASRRELVQSKSASISEHDPEVPRRAVSKAAKQFQTKIGQDKLNSRLNKFFLDAKTLEEEQGVNILYLAIGFLKWYESATSDEFRESPLILIPVKLERDKRNSTIEISGRDEDISINLPLSERMKSDFRIDLPDFSDEDEWKLGDYFTRVQDAISTQKRWTIDRSGIELGFFSFSKLLMFKDLHAENWQNESLLNHPLVISLLNSGFAQEGNVFTSSTKMDEYFTPEKLFHVVEADASQAKVIETVRLGKNLVVQGPPGTGKSQTITNIIAAAVHDQKTVLFIAEKMVALSVVYERLKKVGLRPACLELHSNKVNKKLVMESIKLTIDQATRFQHEHGKKVASISGLNNNNEAFVRTRDTLNLSTEILHSKIESSDDTVFDVIGELVWAIANKIPPASTKNMPINKLYLKKDYDRVLEATRNLANKINRIGSVKDSPWYCVGNIDLQPIDLTRIINSISEIKDLSVYYSILKAVSEAIDLPCPQSLAQSSQPKTKYRFLFKIYWLYTLCLFKLVKRDMHLIKSGMTLENTAKELRIKISAIADELNFTVQSGGDTLNILEIEFEVQSRIIVGWQNSQDQYDDWCQLVKARRNLESMGFESLAARMISGDFPQDAAVSELRYARADSLWRLALNQHPEIMDMDAGKRDDLVETFQQLNLARQKEVSSVIIANHLDQVPLGYDGQMKYIRGQTDGKRHKPIRKLIEHAGHTVQKIKPVFLMSPISVAQFLPPDKIKFDLLIIDEASQVCPEDAFGVIARSNQLVVVGDSKQLPPTNFFNRLSSNDAYDDEDEDDDTNEESTDAGFDRNAGHATDMESILTLCAARGMTSRMLEWHYRSRHHSLIEISNYKFYRNSLILPPSPFGKETSLGMIFNRVEGAYDRGGKRINTIEAAAIVTAVVEHARNTPTLSLGIATLSSSQKTELGNQLQIARQNNQILNDFMTEMELIEEVFVKNLENVQGDERDVIMISVGYGPKISGTKLDSMNFGPIQKDGGERRLNVLFTRARHRCEIFCSFDPGEIDLNRSSSNGVRVFREFLKYAQTGKIEETHSTGEEFDSPFEEDVANQIMQLGYSVDCQVGSAGFKIDLGVRHPNRKGDYMLAVECDGATYHNSVWARDRDYMRQLTLEAMGWKFHRIWSTDWFYRRDKEILKLKDALNNAKKYEPEIAEKIFKESKNESSFRIDIELPEQKLDYTVERIPYAVAEMEIRTVQEPHKVNKLTMMQIIRQVIEVEGPIHKNLLPIRVASLFGKNRAGVRIVDAVSDSAKLLVRSDKEILFENDCYFTIQQQETPVVRDRSSAPLPIKMTENLPSMEVNTAIFEVLRESGAVKIGQIPTAVASKFGYQRTGSELSSLVINQVNILRKQGVICSLEGDEEFLKLV